MRLYDIQMKEMCSFKGIMLSIYTVLWKGSMEFSSHRGFITPNVLAADCYLRQWYAVYCTVCIQKTNLFMYHTNIMVYIDFYTMEYIHNYTYV